MHTFEYFERLPVGDGDYDEEPLTRAEFGKRVADCGKGTIQPSDDGEYGLERIWIEEDPYRLHSCELVIRVTK